MIFIVKFLLLMLVKLIRNISIHFKLMSLNVQLKLVAMEFRFCFSPVPTARLC